MFLLCLMDKDETWQLVCRWGLPLADLDVACSSLLVELWLMREHVVVIT